MRQIVLIYGQAADPFFEKEIDYIAQRFKIAAILTYADEYDEACEVLKAHSLDPKLLIQVPGLYRHPLRLLSWLSGKDVRREIFSRTLKGPRKLKRLAYLLFYGMFALSAEEILTRQKIGGEDLCIYSFWASRGGYAAAYLKSRPAYENTFCLCRAHGYDLYEDRNDTGYIPFRRFLNDHLDRIAFISQQGRDYFEERFPSPDNKVLSYLGTPDPCLPARQILPAQSLCIATCSEVCDVKRLVYIIAAIEALDPMNVTWIHIGDGPLMEQVKQLAEEKLRGTHVSWEFTGRIPNDQVLKLYAERNVDFLLNLSDSEGLPVSIMEAFSMGIPCIARNVGGMAEILEPGAGLLLPRQWEADTPAKIRSFVSCRLESSEAYESMCCRAREIWKEKFDADRNYSAFFDSFA